MGGTGVPINFDAPAVLRKWPSLRNQRRTEGAGPYLLVDGTLDECIGEFMAKPTASRRAAAGFSLIRIRPAAPGVISLSLIMSAGRASIGHAS